MGRPGGGLRKHDGQTQTGADSHEPEKVDEPVEYEQHNCFKHAEVVCRQWHDTMCPHQELPAHHGEQL